MKTYCALHLPRQGRAKIWRRRVAKRQRRPWRNTQAPPWSALATR